MQRELEVQKAMRGKVSLPLGFWVLAWSVLVTVMGLAVSIGIAQGNITYRLAAVEVELASMSARIERHIDSPGHPVSIERLNAVQERLEDMEQGRVRRAQR